MLERNTRNIKGTEYISGGLLIRPDFSLMGQAAFLITVVIASGGGGGGLILFHHGSERPRDGASLQRQHQLFR